MKKRLSAHPAPYSKEIVPVLKRLVSEYAPTTGVLLDPMAGAGQSLPEIAGIDFVPMGVEIEPGYFELGLTHPCVVNSDSTSLSWLYESSVAAAVTSVPYPNGVSDNFVALDDSVRHTYVHRIRQYLPSYTLHPNNSGGMNPRRSPKALAKFMAVHQRIYDEVFRVLRPGAPFVWNGKDTTKVDFIDQSAAQLVKSGFEIAHREIVGTPGLNHGANRDLKVQGEAVLVAVKPS